MSAKKRPSVNFMFNPDVPASKHRLESQNHVDLDVRRALDGQMAEALRFHGRQVVNVWNFFFEVSPNAQCR